MTTKARFTAIHCLNKGIKMLDGTSDLSTENGQPFPPITNKAAEISCPLAYRSLDADARCVLVAAIPKLAANNIGESSTGISNAIRVSSGEFATMWKINEPVQAFVRLVRGCEILKCSTVRYSWYPKPGVQCIHDSSWLISSYCLEIPAEIGLSFVPLSTGSLRRLLQEIRTDEELALGPPRRLPYACRSMHREGWISIAPPRFPRAVLLPCAGNPAISFRGICQRSSWRTWREHTSAWKPFPASGVVG